MNSGNEKNNTEFSYEYFKEREYFGKQGVNYENVKRNPIGTCAVLRFKQYFWSLLLAVAHGLCCLCEYQNTVLLICLGVLLSVFFI
jgi:hypothetical protein